MGKKHPSVQLENLTKAELRVAEDICELNCWRTPPRLLEYFGRPLNEDEITSTMNALAAIVPYEKWIRVWQAQDNGVPYVAQHIVEGEKK